MKRFCTITLLVSLLAVCGCASPFRDPLKADYESGRISREEYLQLRLAREEAMARTAPAHWELQQTVAQNRFRLSHE